MGILDVFKKKEEEPFPQRPPPIDFGPSREMGMGGPMDMGGPAPSIGLPPPPSPPMKGKEGVTLLTEDLEEISEAIVEEKWTKFSEEWDKMIDWKEKIDDAVVELRTSLENIEKQIDTVEKAVLGKVDEYAKGMGDVRTELKAMQKVFGDVMPVFTESVKKLKEVAEEK